MSENRYFVILVIALILTLGAAWLYDSRSVINWGFGEYTTTTTSKSVETDPITNQQKAIETTTTQTHQGKTVWDWLQLVFIPVGLAGVALLFNIQAKRRELDFLYTEKQVTTLQTYLDNMKDLLTNTDLMKQKDDKDSPVRAVAQTLTTTAFRMLELEGRNVITQFLYSAELHDTLMNGSDLTFADLSGTNFYHFSFIAGGFLGIDLSKTNLTDAVFIKADLTGANLTDAILEGTDLRNANLSNARVTIEQLSKAKSLRGATMPDGTIHD